MNLPFHISINDYTYPLPDDRIAKYPLSERDNSKLLVFDQQITESTFKSISNFLPAPALLVANNTKVIKARMEFFKSTGARIEVFCLEPWVPLEYSQMFIQNTTCQWVCYVGNSKKWKDGLLIKTLQWSDLKTELSVKKIKPVNDAFIIEFNWDNPNVTFGEILDLCGEIPIPPYLNRASEDSDTERYQTVYSRVKGSVAAPTAGLHFTDKVFESLSKKGIRNHQVTLHVGAGTFKPVQSEMIQNHAMHTEHFVLSKEILKPLIENGDPLIAVGTTTVRTLESIYWIGVKLLENKPDPLHVDQWEAYELNSQIDVKDSLQTIFDYLDKTNETSLMASTAIMIAPGYKFKTVDYLITNFHQPQSTLLLLIAAFIGDEWKNCYQYALKHNFRFLSYGDSCLFKRK